MGCALGGEFLGGPAFLLLVGAGGPAVRHQVYKGHPSYKYIMPKVRRCICIDPDVDEELRRRPWLNASQTINRFLRRYLGLDKEDPTSV